VAKIEVRSNQSNDDSDKWNDLFKLRIQDKESVAATDEYADS